MYYIEKKFLEYGIRHSQWITVQTRQQEACLQSHYGRGALGVVPNFHPMPQESIEKSNRVTILWVSNLKPLKQPEYFIRLARDLQQLGQDAPQCYMIGAPAGWDPGWQSSLEEQMRGIENLSYLGSRPIEEVNEILAKAHIFVNTSLYEGFPNTFIQAWMRKVPVVSLNVDPDGILMNRGIGLCSRTYERMFKDIVHLIENHQYRQQMGEKAQSFAFETYSERNILQFVKILSSHDGTLTAH
jgi:glycosyltransferase involved in cell wall biosynthesis